MEKRGMSEIITIVILVALVLVAIGIVWAVILNIIRGNTETIQSNADKLLSEGINYGKESGGPNEEGDEELFSFKDNFSSDTTQDYIWDGVDTNPPFNQNYWDEANNWIVIKTGDNDIVNIERIIDLPLSGYAKIKFIKRGDYPVSHTQHFQIFKNDSEYYDFAWGDSSYGGQGLSVIVNYAVVESAVGYGTVVSNTEYVIETWWNSTYLRLDINGELIKELVINQGIISQPVKFVLHNSQIDIDLVSIEILDQELLDN